MRIDRQEFSLKMPRCASEFPEGDLQPFAVRYGALGQQLVDGCVRGDEGQPVGEFESATLMNRSV
jgi:hypothetical protein